MFTGRLKALPLLLLLLLEQARNLLTRCARRHKECLGTCANNGHGP
jgi:hypothetical protein